jgi:hypothetical protein
LKVEEGQKATTATLYAIAKEGLDALFGVIIL